MVEDKSRLTIDKHDKYRAFAWKLGGFLPPLL